MALIVTAEDRRALAGFGGDYTLSLVLTLPTGSVELTVTPVRFERQGEAEDANFLVGARITDMDGRDRVRLMEFIRELAGRA